MPDLVYGADALDAARVAVATQAQHVRALTDAVVATPVAGFGGLADGGLADAVERLRTALRTDLAAAGDRLAGAERALDATERSIRDADGRSAASLAPGR